VDKMSILLAQVLLVLGAIYIITKAISDIQDHQRKIRMSIVAIGKRNRQKKARWTPYPQTEKEIEEETEEDTAFAMPIDMLEEKN
jgi:hypothetical protein